jgi:O-antigen ligase
VLWTPKLAYRGSLTTTFVNHNTAATFVGVGATLWFCSAFSSLQSFRFSSLRDLLLTPSNERLLLRTILRSGAALTCFFALLLTGSRGGLICSCFGFLVAIVLMLAGQQKWRFWQIAISVGVVSVITVTLLSRIGRIGSEGVFDDARWSIYGFCLEAIQRRPFLGVGAGTFADIFPSILSDSVYGWGVWDHAHSTILEIAVEMGVPVAIVVVIATMASLFILVRATLNTTGRGRRSLAAITGIAVLGYSHSLIDFSLQIPGFLVVFSILLGSGLARATALENESTRSRTGRELDDQKVSSK